MDTDLVRGHILIVCTGNVCRSPYAERLLTSRLTLGGIKISSAGTAALVGADMDQRIRKRLIRARADASAFKARQLTSEMLQEADLVLCATRAHRSHVVRLSPRTVRRTFALAEFSDLARIMPSISNDPRDARYSEKSLVKEVAFEAARYRQNVKPRSVADSDIVDPYRRASAVVDRMADQIDALTRPLIELFGGLWDQS
ncbi:low molecular weight phosphatase family protein [Microlunatus endophyticus]|uniref:Low molecular weight phosphatase family protein n=1 Tax=Microlunatus endophyticus TaxID=1716077 RepID=A0A917SIT3_9ACTN|nr:hypothetical protein [Microlunatus endophyticus]GGL83202.1 low molecular weight phosphatase family protein [Microlunatus endophyticus]